MVKEVKPMKEKKPETRKKGHRLNPLPTNSTVDAG